MEHFGLYTFAFFLALSLVVFSERAKLRRKTVSDWIVDTASLFMHFFVVPALQIVVVGGLLRTFFPQWRGTLPSSLGVSFLLYLAIDYAWYWNHRILHSQTPLWRLHRTHHAPVEIDVFVTARNLLVTHFLMVYFWAIGVAVFLLADPTIFLGFAAFGLVLNFWGHTSFVLPCENPLNRAFAAIFVTPREHLWHHSRERPHCNFGTVISVWDRLHGTFYCESEPPKEFGETYRKTPWNQLFWPF